MPQTLSFRKKRYTEADCSLVLALLNGEHGLRGRGSGPCSGAACGGRAVGWACVSHIDCWFMIQRFVGEGISPTPRREVAATHEEWSRGEGCQASRKVWLPLASLGLLLFGLRHHPDGSWIPSCGGEIWLLVGP